MLCLRVRTYKWSVMLTSDNWVPSDGSRASCTASRKYQRTQVEQLESSIDSAGLTQILVCGNCVKVSLVLSRIVRVDKSVIDHEYIRRKLVSGFGGTLTSIDPSRMAEGVLDLRERY